jgi:tetratricopeptide (TPR) repeat protein
MNLLLVSLLLQSLLLPPRYAMENPGTLSAISKKLKNDYDKLWSRFLEGKDDAKVLTDFDKLLKKQKNFEAAFLVQAYIHLYQRNDPEAVNKFEQALAVNPNNRIAIYYLAELAFARSDYARASDLYTKLLAIINPRSDLETKRQKALLLSTENLLRSADRAEQENRLASAEELYRQTLLIAPNEPTFHSRLAELLIKEKKWDEALVHFRRQLELEGRREETERNIAEALMNLGRTEEAREVLERLRKKGSGDENLEAKVSELEDLGRWGIDIGSFREIKDTDSLTREQLAALIVRYFPQVTEFRQNPQIVTDIQNSWARTEIQTVVGIGLIDPLPNHSFEPATPISRGHFALLLGRMIRLLSISPNNTPPIPVTDVVSSSILYSEIQLVVGLGLMNLDDAGNFNVTSSMSGKEAVSAVEHLLALSRRKDVQESIPR